MIQLPVSPEEIRALAQGMCGDLIRWRRDFHQYPELSHQEERTARVVASQLMALGLEVRTGLSGHGVLGVLRGRRSGRVVAYRADMDALPLGEQVDVPWRSQVPGVMHACGHDFHLSIALGTARLLSHLQDRLAGEFRFIFQPAEEGPQEGGLSGAQGLVAAGVLDNPPVAAIFALHVAPNLEVGHFWYSPEVVMAGSEHLLLTVTGKAVHGATPHRGVDAILVSAQVIHHIQAFLAQGIDARLPVVLTFGRICGGSRFNILAEQVVMEGSLRYLQETARDHTLNGLRRLLGGLSQASGARLDLQARTIYPILKNDAALSPLAVEVLCRVLGANRLLLHQPAMGSEDFAFFAQKAPAFYFFLGVRSPGSPGHSLHSPEFDPDEAALPWGVQAAAALLMALSEPETPWEVKRTAKNS